MVIDLNNRPECQISDNLLKAWLLHGLPDNYNSFV